MILSVSRRTDVPSFYGDWFMERLKNGYVLTQNPMNPTQINRISLSPEVVDCIVFWTKDPQPMLAHLDEMDAMGYRYYFQFTLTPYDRRVERNLRPKSDIEATFLALSKRLGQHRVVWRYDPILLADGIDLSYHKAQFLRMCELFAGAADMVVISFVDLYRKLKAPVFSPPTASERQELAAYIGETANRFGIRPVACCEGEDYARYGIGRSSCIDKARIESVIGCPIAARQDQNQRTGCGCVESIDIGVYDTCGNGCIYCYANRNHAKAAEHMRACSRSSPLLCAVIPDGVAVREKRVASLKETQLRLW